MSYFVRLNGKAFGPFNEEQLKNMRINGKLSLYTEVSDNRIDWQPAENLTFLFPPPPPPAPQPEPQPEPPPSPSGISPSTSLTILPQDPSLPPATQTQPGESTEWYYSIDGEKGYGPLAAATIKRMLQDKTLSRKTYVWRQGENSRYIEEEPYFDEAVMATSMKTLGNLTADPMKVTADGTLIYSASIVPPLAKSLGWLMFLKVTALIYVIFAVLGTLWFTIYSFSMAIGTNAISVLLITMLGIAVDISVLALIVKTLLCLWKYHTTLQKAVISKKEYDLLQANQNLLLFWKWTGILIVTVLALVFIGISTLIALIGFGSGFVMNL